MQPGAFAGAAFAPTARTSLAVPCPAATSSSPTAPKSCGDIPLPLRQVRPGGDLPCPSTRSLLLPQNPDISPGNVSLRLLFPASYLPDFRPGCHYLQTHLCVAISPRRLHFSGRLPLGSGGPGDAGALMQPGHAPGATALPSRSVLAWQGLPSLLGRGGMRRYLGVPLERCEWIQGCERRGWVRSVPRRCQEENWGC